MMSFLFWFILVPNRPKSDFCIFKNLIFIFPIPPSWLKYRDLSSIFQNFFQRFRKFIQTSIQKSPDLVQKIELVPIPFPQNTKTRNFGIQKQCFHSRRCGSYNNNLRSNLSLIILPPILGGGPIQTIQACNPFEQEIY